MPASTGAVGAQNEVTEEARFLRHTGLSTFGLRAEVRGERGRAGALHEGAQGMDSLRHDGGRREANLPVQVPTVCEEIYAEKGAEEAHADASREGIRVPL